MDAETVRAGFRQTLDGLRRRWFLSVWLKVAALWLLATAISIGGAWSVSRFVQPAGVALVALWVCVPVLSLAALAVLGWRWWSRPTDLQVARFVEERCPEFEQQLISAATVADESQLRPMQQLVLADAARAMARLDLDRVVARADLAKVGLACAAALLAVVAGGLWSWPHAQRAWQAGRALAFPGSVALVVEPGDVRVVEGGTVPLRVRIEGVPVEAWSSQVKVVATAPHLREAPPLATRDGVFAADLPAGEHSFSYRVVSGALASPEYRVTVRRQPRVDRIAVRYEYPKFSGLAPRVDEDSGDVFAPAGTKVTVQVHTLTPVTAGTLTLGESPVSLQARSPHALEGEFVLKADDAYRVTLDDGEGLTNTGDTEYFVRVMDDRPPDVRILRPGGDAKVTRLEEVVVEARADDDFGLTRFELVFAPQGGREQVVPLSRGGGTSATGQHTIYLEDLDVKPGDFVTYYARARDIGRGKPSTETRSDIFFLEVRPFNEEFEAARSQAGMSGGADGDFDDLARLQKDIIVATWRLDRRQAGGAGKSAQDIRTVAKSQSDLKAKAAQLAARLAVAPQQPRGRPRQGATPAPTAPLPASPTAPNPMQRAVEAMGRAQSALEGLSTSSALPHENAALNELLRAQADVRRRQVAMQQQSQGGRGGRSGNQDLSALFDRELQRQQATNYEQRATTESREEKKEDETQRRLRELAARQDEVGREQRELARRREQLPAEEMKRRLERLTREQEELQRQAEDLARRMQQESRSAQNQAGQQGQQGQQGQAGQQQSQGNSASSSAGAQGGQAQGGQQDAADRLRSAAAEMGAAAGELQRESPGAASDRSQRALERLRAAARESDGQGPDDRRRRASDLQSEARQLADATKRLADDADGAARAGDRDGVGRLASQQQRLAERADALERGAHTLSEQTNATGSARQGSQGTEGREAKAVAEGVRRAARDLSAGKVGERLRQGAQAARSAAEGGGTPLDAGRQLASSGRGASEALERVADQLAQATGQDAESRKLSDALDQTRRLREGLANAEREGSAQTPGAGGRTQRADGRPSPRQANDGSRQQPGQQAQQSQSGQQGQSGQSGAQGNAGGGRGNDAGGTARAQADFIRQLREQRDLLDALQRENPGLGARMQSLEGWVPSNSAPGTEPWKQDRSKWEALKRDVTLAIEKYEASATQRLAARDARQRLDAGGDEPVPETWRQDVADYFKAISRKPRQ